MVSVSRWVIKLESNRHWTLNLDLLARTQINEATALLVVIIYSVHSKTEFCFL